jgi:drug/metabolite transporter (DMT)-like permease
VQMLKSCCPVFVLFVALAFRLEHFSVPLISSIVLIAAGTATTAASGVSAVSLLGLLIQFSSELCEAFRLCLAQILMCNMKLHQFEALKYMSSACVMFLCVGIWFLEWQRFSEQRAWERVMMHLQWYIAAGAPSS